ncbi:RidA family protein [Nocardia sp. NPDC004278]|uniref:RidA family protein n=1 Tax=Nocardia sp. NPDC004604 TaxID=3157013 RepID=UPI0033A7AC99
MSAPGGTPQRVSIHVDGLEHGTLPIPAASRIGSLIATGGVRGVDPATGQMPDDAAAQVRLMFDNLVRIVEAAGGGAGSILKVDVRVVERSVREHLDAVWVEHFPDPASRPARHMQVATLAPGMQVQCEALAVTVSEEVNL